MNLTSRWQELAADLGLRPGHEVVAAELLAAYRSAGRHYHTADHLDAVLRGLDELWEGSPVPPAAARAAAWFHDVVYDPRRSDNEAASAALAERLLGEWGAAAATVQEVAALVAATATHEVVAVAGAAELLDADLAILGAPADVYDRYAVAVRREYAHVPDDAFWVGRADVLGRLLARPRLYVTCAARLRFELDARANLRRELDRLGAPGADADADDVVSGGAAADPRGAAGG